MVSQEVEIVNKLGLHARAAAKFVTLASDYPCEVFITKGGRRVNGKSIMGVMMLAASKGSTVIIDVEGEQEGVALNDLCALVANKFGEGE